MHPGSLLLVLLLAADAVPDPAADVRYVWVYETRLLSQPEGPPVPSVRALPVGESVTVASCADGLCAVTVPRLEARGWVPEANLGRTRPTEKQLALRAASSLERACELAPDEECLKALEAAYRLAGESKKAAAVASRRNARALTELARHPIRFARMNVTDSRPLLRDGERVLALCPEGPRWLPVRVRNLEGPAGGFDVVVPCKPAGSDGPPPLPVYAIAGLPRTNVRIGAVTAEYPDGFPESVARLDGQELRTAGRQGGWGRSGCSSPRTRGECTWVSLPPRGSASRGTSMATGSWMSSCRSAVPPAASARRGLLLSSKSTVTPLPAIVARAEESTECD